MAYDTEQVETLVRASLYMFGASLFPEFIRIEGSP